MTTPEPDRARLLIPTPRRELLAGGATRAQLDVELRAGRSISVYRGVHATATQATTFLGRVRAALATQGPMSVATLTTAAAVHALRWLPESWLGSAVTVHVAVAQDDAHRHRDGIRLHRRRIEPDDVVVIGGVRCFSATRTLVELARSPDVPRLLAVQILDGALRDKRTTRQELEACLARFTGERGIARARELVKQSREGVDSPPETKIRLMLAQGGLPDVDVNIEIRDDDGTVLARGDLGYRRFLIWGEYDGFESHSRRPQFRNDRVGDRWLQRRGWHVMRFVDQDFDRPRSVCREWLNAVADAPARIAALPADRSLEVAAARRMLGLD